MYTPSLPLSSMFSTPFFSFLLFLHFFFSSLFLKTSLFLSFFLSSLITKLLFFAGACKKCYSTYLPNLLDWTPIALFMRPHISKTRSIPTPFFSFVWFIFSSLLFFSFLFFSFLFFSFLFFSFLFFYITSHAVLQEIICRQRQPTQLLLWA